MLQQKKAEKEQLVGNKKYVRRSELEEARLKRVREEEEAERRAKEQKRLRLTSGGTTPDGRPATPIDADIDKNDAAGAAAAAAAAASPGGAAAGGAPPSPTPAAAVPALPRNEVIRRLRALGQPATLFGEEDADRQARLLKVEKTVALVDETRGGQQENVLLMLKRQEKAKAKQAAGDKAAAGSRAAAGDKQAASRAAAASGGGAGEGPARPTQEGNAAAAEGTGPGSSAAATAAGAAAGSTSGEDVLLESFKAAAARVAEQRAEEAMPIEDRMSKLIKGWCAEWEADLEARPEEVKMTGAGHQATLVFKQSMTYFEPLYERLKRRQLDDELKVGLWMLVEHMRDRNYLAANDVYLKLAIGNAPWPIGVTQVGLHERSAREKISHSMNSTSQAHIMNDEATRKFFQAIKRLMTNLQRLRPTDPSRSVDFDVHGDIGRGVAGGGSNRVALLEAQAHGEVPLALPAAPHMMAPDGSVKVPPKWDRVLRHQAKGLGIEDLGAGDEDEEAAAANRAGRQRQH